MSSKVEEKINEAAAEIEDAELEGQEIAAEKADKNPLTKNQITGKGLEIDDLDPDKDYGTFDGKYYEVKVLSMAELEHFLNNGSKKQKEDATKDIKSKLAGMGEKDLKKALENAKTDNLQNLIEEQISSDGSGKYDCEECACWGYPDHMARFNTAPGPKVCHIVGHEAYKQLCKTGLSEGNAMKTVEKCEEDGDYGDGECFRAKDQNPIYKLLQDGSMCFVPDKKLADKFCKGDVKTAVGCAGEDESDKYGEATKKQDNIGLK